MSDEASTMDLREFIATSLTQIQEGVQDAIARRSVPGASGVINPVWGTAEDIKPSHVREVQFDVAVSASEQTAMGGKAGIRVLSVAQVGGEAANKSEYSRVSHIRFVVPIVSPVQLVSRTRRS